MVVVGDIMSPGSVSLPPSATVEEAVKLMAENNIGSVLVVQEGRLVGIFTERDLIKLVAAGKPLSVRLEEVMTKNPVTVKPDTPFIVALARMVEFNIRHLPVVDNEGRPVGVVSVRDIIRNL